VADPATLLTGIKGFLDDDEARHLYDMALWAGVAGPCLEVGSYCGKSAVCLGTACRENNAVLFSIDHHRGSEEQQPGEAYFDPALFDHRAGRDSERDAGLHIDIAGQQHEPLPGGVAADVLLAELRGLRLLAPGRQHNGHQ